MSESVEIEITGREAKLILKYGCPFPEQEEIFQAVSGKGGFHIVSVDKYWLELIFGDLCRSIRDVRSQSLIEDLDAICDNLEAAINPAITRY